MGGSVIAAFDNSGLVFGVACTDTQMIALYDKSTLDTVSLHQTRPLVQTLNSGLPWSPCFILCIGLATLTTSADAFALRV